MRTILLLLAGLVATAPLQAQSNAPVRLALATEAAKAPRPRVALMDFLSDDNSCRSMAALSDLVGALQVEMSRETDYEWVERNELDKAMKEFNLAGFSFIDRAEGIRAGHWVGANWAVFGDLSTNFNGSRILSLEIVNLQRADILAVTNLPLSTSNSDYFQMKTEHVPYIASALRTLLNHAQQVYANSQKLDVVAFLFLSTSQTGPRDAFKNLEDDFRNSLLAESTNHQKFHLVQFQRPGVAMDEANLVLSGLAESDSNSWNRVADQYVWGGARADYRRIFNRSTRNWQDENILSVTLNVWDGRGEPRAITVILTNETAETVASELVRTIEPLFRRDTTKPIVEDVRCRISASIYTNNFQGDASEDTHIGNLYTSVSARNIGFDSPEGRRQWFDAVQLLETACLFDPGNAAAREQLLRLRWGIESNSRNKFSFAIRRSEAWGKYVEQFGFSRALANPASPSIAAEYVLSAWHPFEMFEYAQVQREEWGEPRDAGLREITQWENQLGSEFVSRLLAAPDDPAFHSLIMAFFYHSLDIPDLATRRKMVDGLWPRILEQARKESLGFAGDYRQTLARYFEEIGKPGGEEQLLAQFDAANKEAAARQITNKPPQSSVRLPRITELKPAPAADIFSLPSMTFRPLLTEPAIRTISFPPGIQAKRIKSMIFHNDTLWLTVEVAEPLEITSVNPQIERDFQPVSVDHVRLWKMDASTLRLEAVGGPLATNDINGMMFRSNTLWLALNDEGIAALNINTGELRRYESSAGVAATNQFALADTSHGVFAIGGLGDLLFLGNGRETWTNYVAKVPPQNFFYGGDLRQIVGLKSRLLVYNSQLLLCDLNSNIGTRIVDQSTLDRIGRPLSMMADGRGLVWIASNSGLHCLDPDTGKTQSQWVPVSPTIQGVAQPTFFKLPPVNKTDLQLEAEIRQKLELRQRLLRTEKTNTNQPDLFWSNSRLPAGVLSVAEDGDFLWVLTRETTHPLLYHPASHSWVGGYSIKNLVRQAWDGDTYLIEDRGTPSILACGGGKLWLAAQLWDSAVILAIDTGTLKSTPPERWLPDRVSQEEVAARLAGMSAHERAVYYFFAGNDAAVVQSLQSQPENKRDAESLFLLGRCYAEMGVSNQASRLEQELAKAFPDSAFTKIESADKRSKKLHAKIEEHLKVNPSPESNLPDAVAGWLVRNCDANGDGALDGDELTVFFELMPERIRPFVSRINLTPAAAATELIRKYDRNRNERLEDPELLTAIARPFSGPGQPALLWTNKPFYHQSQTIKP
ncbi:MAG TPA: hypothetical protein VFY06_01890 [Verrucomicrobiae bacterium]|nr:hypothetical protein [Verrucomicrobiae bacterium]